jgi:transcriptional regulator with GAF, ATPase, and Fis domain
VADDTIRASKRESQVVEAFVMLADTLVDDYDVIEFLNVLSERCVALVDADEAGIMIADSRGQLQVVASSSERTRLLELFEIQNQDGPSLDAFKTANPIITGDLGATDVRWPAFASQALSVGFHSVHCEPLRLRSESVGALSLLRSSPGSMREADQTLVRALAQVATIGLLQQRVVSASRATSANLQAALTSRVHIEQAKGVIAERHEVDIDTAFQMLRSHARSHQRQLSELAAAVVKNEVDISTQS